MNTLNLHNWDIVCLSAYLVMLVYIGYRAYRKTNISDQSDFLLGNRSLSLPAFVATLVTTWYGGILGIGEFTYLYGISTWVIMGIPYYIFAAAFALLIAGKIRQTGQYTIADLFYKHYGKPAGMLGSIFLLFMTTPAPYVLMIALLLQIIFGWSFILSLIVGISASTLYVFFGGFRSVVQTDKFQFFLIYAGFIIFLFFLLNQYGGPSFLIKELPDLHLTWHGGNTYQYMIVWFFLASWTFIDPGFFQRCAAAKTTTVAKKGILISIGFWFVFDILTLTTGLYAAAVLEDINPVMAYPLLADKILPPFIKGLFFTGLLAVIMSTIDSFTLLSAITFGRDIVWRIKGSNSNHIGMYTRVGLVLTALSALILCYLFPSVIELWYVIGSLFIPPMLLPLISVYFPKMRLPGRQILTIMIVSFIISLFSFLWGQWASIEGAPAYLFQIEPFFSGFIISILLYLGFLFKPGTSEAV